MENAKQLQQVQNTAPDSKWEILKCGKQSFYTYTDEQHKLLSRDRKCNRKQYNDLAWLDYCDFKILSFCILKVISMIMHIREDCNLFTNKSKVETIRKDLVHYQDEIEKLAETVLKCKSDPDEKEYKKSSTKFYKKALELKETLLKSKTVETYSELFIKSHLEDLSNIPEQKDSNQLLAALQQLKETSSFDSELELDQPVYETTDLKSIIKHKDRQLAECRKIITGLNELLETQQEQILELKEQFQQHI